MSAGLGSESRDEWDERQQRFRGRVRRSFDPVSGTLVVVPSLSFAEAELAKITAIQFYEERLLCFILMLREPRLRLVYATSVPVDPAIVDYHLGLLPDPEDARRRLHLVTPDDDAHRPLSAKILERPAVLEALLGHIDDHDDAHLLPFTVTPLELELARRLRLPMDAANPEQAVLGSKTGSRRTARSAGVAVLDGSEDLWSVAAVSGVAHGLAAAGAPGVVVKLNNSFSGQGNVILPANGLRDPLPDSETIFCAGGETWSTYTAKVEADGAIVEALLPPGAAMSPSAQLRIATDGRVEVLSTHDQVLGGPHEQVYLGCRYPARAAYRERIEAAALRVGAVLAGEGVIGSFGIDFLVTPEQVYLSEINLRMGGTTHPFHMARLVTGGPMRGVRYVATDNLKSASLIGPPEAVLERLAAAGLLFRPGMAEGATVHLLGALRAFGKMGVTCIAPTRDGADQLYAEVLGCLDVAAD